MDITEFNTITQDILSNLDDQGTVSNKLAELTQGFTEEAQARSSADQQVTDLTAANDKLREDNMKLFLRATQPVETKQIKTEPDKPSPDAADPIAELFKGGGINWQKE